ncbi:MAG: metallophosphoesterase [Desulfurococcales archaeon]|jgi:Icc-related predicted phosphoesterase|nr:metallophosphoesterase [Desulfurococcales archaeon]
MVAYIEIMAVSDVHSPRYLPLFISSLKSLLNYKPDLVLFGGDMIDKGDVGSLKPIVDFLSSRFPRTPIISVFGNEEYIEKAKILRDVYNSVNWLDDEYWEGEIAGIKICVYGTRGSLEKPTTWQKRNLPNIEEVFEKRVAMARENMARLRTTCNVLILLMHYAPTTKTLKGEPISTYPYLCHRGFERVISEVKPDLVIHGHAHASTIHTAEISGVPVYNVAIPAVKDVTRIRVSIDDNSSKPRSSKVG